MQGFNQRTRNFPAMAPTSMNQAGENLLDPVQVYELLSNLCQFLSGQGTGFAAMSPVIEPQELTDFVQAEAHSLGTLDEIHALDIALVITPNSTLLALRLR